MSNDKIISASDISKVRSKHGHQKIVFTNGCFDILHVGHIRCLQAARALGDILVLGLNSDLSVKRLKGNSRPINPQDERAEMLAQYNFIDYIVIFDGDTPEDIVRQLRPDIWAKGGDWNAANLPGNELAQELGIELVFVPYIQGRSTTEILNRSACSTEKAELNIAVIGDAALDYSYITKKSDELSAETALQVNYVTQVTADAGGAGNLASDIAVLGKTKVDLYSFIGTDNYAELLKQSLINNGVCIDYLLPCRQTKTYVYHRIFDEHFSELPRYDIGPGNIYSDSDTDRLLSFIEKNAASYDMIVVNQQLSSGIYSGKFIARLQKIINTLRVPVWLDTRTAPFLYGCSYKINLSEAQKITGVDDPEVCIRRIYDTYIGEHKATPFPCYVVITLGENGAIAFNGKRLYQVSGIKTDWKKDTVGAGDAFLASLCHSIASGINFDSALKRANAAGTASTKYLRACGHPSREEIEILL